MYWAPMKRNPRRRPCPNPYSTPMSMTKVQHDFHFHLQHARNSDKTGNPLCAYSAGSERGVYGLWPRRHSAQRAQRHLENNGDNLGSTPLHRAGPVTPFISPPHGCREGERVPNLRIRGTSPTLWDSGSCLLHVLPLSCLDLCVRSKCYCL